MYQSTNRVLAGFTSIFARGGRGARHGSGSGSTSTKIRLILFVRPVSTVTRTQAAATESRTPPSCSPHQYINSPSAADDCRHKMRRSTFKFKEDEQFDTGTAAADAGGGKGNVKKKNWCAVALGSNWHGNRVRKLELAVSKLAATTADDVRRAEADAAARGSTSAGCSRSEDAGDGGGGAFPSRDSCSARGDVEKLITLTQFSSLYESVAEPKFLPRASRAGGVRSNADGNCDTETTRKTMTKEKPSEQDLGSYLNAVVSLLTELSPVQLLLRLQQIEAECGRPQTSAADRQRQLEQDPTYFPAPRPVDLDILLVNDEVYDLTVVEPYLTVPHPRMLDRAFVLKPLKELLRVDRRENLRHPVTGQLFCSDLCPPTIEEQQLVRFIPGLSSIQRAVRVGGTAPDGDGSGALQRFRATKHMVMGILNVTPDSFSDGGQFLPPAEALSQAKKLYVEDGCDVVDVGGESTRPNAEEVPEREELRRLLPVYRGLAEAQIPFSADTRKAAVAAAALRHGTVAVNDVNFGSFDANSSGAASSSDDKDKNKMFSLLAQGLKSLGSVRDKEYKTCPASGTEDPPERDEFCYIGMHTRGSSKDMDLMTAYSLDDFFKRGRHRTESVMVSYLNGYFAWKERELWQVYGIFPWRVVCDPGLGFAKAHAQSLEIVRHAGLFWRPYLCFGHSEKRFVRQFAPQLPLPEDVRLAAKTHARTSSGASARFQLEKAGRGVVDMFLVNNDLEGTDTERTRHVEYHSLPAQEAYMQGSCAENFDDLLTVSTSNSLSSTSMTSTAASTGGPNGDSKNSGVESTPEFLESPFGPPVESERKATMMGFERLLRSGTHAMTYALGQQTSWEMIVRVHDVASTNRFFQEQEENESGAAPLGVREFYSADISATEQDLKSDSDACRVIAKAIERKRKHAVADER